MPFSLREPARGTGEFHTTAARANRTKVERSGFHVLVVFTFLVGVLLVRACPRQIVLSLAAVVQGHQQMCTLVP